MTIKNNMLTKMRINTLYIWMLKKQGL